MLTCSFSLSQIQEPLSHLWTLPSGVSRRITSMLVELMRTCPKEYTIACHYSLSLLCELWVETELWEKILLHVITGAFITCCKMFVVYFPTVLSLSNPGFIFWFELHFLWHPCCKTSGHYAAHLPGHRSCLCPTEDLYRELWCNCVPFHYCGRTRGSEASKSEPPTVCVGVMAGYKGMPEMQPSASASPPQVHCLSIPAFPLASWEM